MSTENSSIYCNTFLPAINVAGQPLAHSVDDKLCALKKVEKIAYKSNYSFYFMPLPFNAILSHPNLWYITVNYNKNKTDQGSTVYLPYLEVREEEALMKVDFGQQFKQMFYLKRLIWKSLESTLAQWKGYTILYE